MTVASDLAAKHGTLRRYFLKIDGLPYVLNQRVAGPDGSDAPIGGAATPSYGVLYAQTHDITDTDILACWRMNAATGADEPDATGNGHTATDNAANTASVAGLFGTARHVGYTTAPYNYFTVAEAAALRPATAVTVSAWFITTAATQTWSGARIIANRQAGTLAADGPWFLGTQTASEIPYLTARVVRDDGSANGTYIGSSLQGTTPLTVGAHLGAMSYDNATGVLNLYLDGRLEATVTVASNKNMIYLGTQYGVRISSALDSINGYQDDCAIYGAAKTLAWHQDVYSGGIGGLNCLRVPSVEYAHDLDIRTMGIPPSQMTFELDDVEDPDDA